VINAEFRNNEIEQNLNEVPLISLRKVNEINALDLGWTASTDQGSFVTGISVAEFKNFLGTKLDGNGPQLRKKQPEEFTVTLEDLPANFDSRTNWPTCKTIGWIRDQSACGTCWAFGAAEAISDRYCTYNVNANLNISAADIGFCCGFSCGDGCNGGYPSAAWDYWVQSGVVSSDCYKYPFPSCDHHIPNSKNPCPSQEYPSPDCPDTCDDGKTKLSMVKHFGADSWSVSGEADIMKEIFENGPVETAFSVYDDFPTYKTGIYVRHSNNFLGGHAVKFIGWGVNDKGTKYWIVANSWNPNWGDQGTFKIIKGNNECGIESESNAGKPKN
jgi:C1A family cysteine protease